MEETNMSEVISEIKNADEDSLREVVEGWFERTRTDGLKIGARFIAAAVMGKIDKHLNKPGKRRCRQNGYQGKKKGRKLCYNDG